MSGPSEGEPEPLEVAAWQMSAGELDAWELPDLAVESLLRGVDSASLRLLAGHTRFDSLQESRDVFRDVIDELGISVPEPEAARWLLIRLAARRVVGGTLDPITALHEIIHRYHRIEWNGDLRVFVGLESMLEDGMDAEETAFAVVEEATLLLARRVPRRWLRLRAGGEAGPLEWTDGTLPLPRPAAPAELSISPGLAESVVKWDEEYRSTTAGWPRRGWFRSTFAAADFVERGRALAARLQRDLGDQFVVEYWQEATAPPGLKFRRTLWSRLGMG
ncbi:hypothetical protein [Schumannella luteola]